MNVLGFSNRSYKGLMALALILNACSTYKAVPVGTIPAAPVPQAKQVQQTKSAVAGMVKKEGFRMIQSGPEYNCLKAVYARLAKQAVPGTPPWPIYLIDAGKKANASAINGNTIIMYTGLMRKFKNDDEVATIVSHEMGHILGQHKNDESAQSKSTWVSVAGVLVGTAAAIGSAYGGVGSGAADLIGDVAQSTVAGVGEGGLIKSYDRAQEYEADQVGLMLMAKAGYDPHAAVNFWRRAEQVFGGSG